MTDIARTSASSWSIRANEVFWGKRVKEHAWQFPQGGIKPGETPEQAMYRELMEEVGLAAEHVKILGRTRQWLRYDVPATWVRRDCRVQLSRAEADLVSATDGRPRLRRLPARVRNVPSSTPGAGATTGCRSRA